MNTLTKILTTLSISLATASSVNATSFEATNNTATTKVCIAAVEGSKIKFKRVIKENHLNFWYVANNIECNDQHIMTFVTKYSKNPQQINSMLSKYRKSPRVEITDLAKL